MVNNSLLKICAALLLSVSAEACCSDRDGETLQSQYDHFTTTPSDINEHLPLLRLLARDCSSAIEIGMRDMISSWAIIQGLSENQFERRSYLGIDINRPHAEIIELAAHLSQVNNVAFYFWQANDLLIDERPAADLLFIDSLHTYTHLTYELETFSPNIHKYIAMHDTSEPWGNVDDTEYLGDYSEYPAHINRSKRGLWPAVEDFLKSHPEWELKERRLNNHGLTILKRVSP